MLKKILEFFGVDKAIIYVVMARGWSVCSGIITLALIAKFLSLNEQGFYFTFASVLALQVIFELGLGTVLVQFVSHEMPKLKIIGGHVVGDDLNLQRFLSIIRLAIKWYIIIAIFVCVSVLPAGLYFFSNASSSMPFATNVNWVQPWGLLVIVSAISLVITPILSIAEGCGYVANIAKLRFYQSLLTGVIAWSTLAAGIGLYATVASSLSLIMVGSYWIYKNFRSLIKQAFSITDAQYSISWLHEIFPIQWRTGVSWLCGYFIFQLFNPIAFKYYGADFAGKLGMSINVVNLMLNLSLSWIMTKVPVFGRLIVEHDITTLDLLYARVFRQSIIFLFLLVILSTICLFLFTAFGFEIANRFVPAPLFFILSLTAIGNHIVACQATYVRSHKVEKYLLNAVITACSMAVMFWFVRDFDKNVMIISYLLIIWFICVPHSIYTIFKFRNGDK